MRRFLVVCLATLVLQSGDLTLLRSSLDQLRKNSPNAARDAQPGSPADKIVTTMSLTDAATPWRARFMASEWLLLAHLRREKLVPVPEVTLEHRDLALAWTLVQNAYEQSQGVLHETKGFEVFRGEDAQKRGASTTALSQRVGVEQVPEALQAAVVSLALEVSVRLLDPEAMAKAAGYAAKRSDLNTRDKAFALMAAAHGSAWADAIRWAKELEGTKVMRAVHDAALADPGNFDYSVFAGLPVPGKAEAGPLAGSTEFEVQDFRLRLLSVQGPEAASKALKAAFGPDWQGTGPLPTRLLRLGAAAHWQKPGKTSLPLTGFASTNRLELRGYLDLSTGGQRKETLSLSPAKGRPRIWTGRLLAEQPTVEGPLSAEFQAEVTLVPARQPGQGSTPKFGSWWRSPDHR